MAVLNALTKYNMLAAQPSQCWTVGFTLPADSNTLGEKGQADGYGNLLHLCTWGAQSAADSAIVPTQTKHFSLKGDEN